jgi:hypothetical protein
MKEAELYEPVKKFLLEKLECDHVYAEVTNYDVLGTCGPLNIIVEMKTRLSFKLLDQAKDALGNAEYVYIAVPMTKNYATLHFIEYEFLRKYGIGFLQVEENKHYKKDSIYSSQQNKYNVTVVCPAKFSNLRRKYKQKNKDSTFYRTIRDSIRPFHETNIGGVKAGGSETEYSNTIKKVKRYLSENGWSSVEDILANVDTHYANPKPSLVATFKQSWNVDWIDTKVENRKTFYNIKPTLEKEEFE